MSEFWDRLIGRLMWGLFEVREWPLAVRRAFLLTLPLSLPAWLVLCALATVIVIAGVLLWWAVSGFLKAVTDALSDAKSLWSAQ